ncbi:MAG: endonuclease/exonuclease/phosphatase family protein [Terriglobia bacterium]
MKNEATDLIDNKGSTIEGSRNEATVVAADLGVSVTETEGPRVTEEIYRLIRERISPHFPEFRQCNSTAELLAHPAYRALEPEIRAVLDTPEVGDFSAGPESESAPVKSQYRFIAWNLERGIEYGGQLEAFRTHPYLKHGDVFLLTETDVGMARSRNRAVAQMLARELGLHYAFVPCYLNLSKGSGVEYDAEGENHLGLHGNAILSRYPIRRVQPIHLKNGIDKMGGREKRLGRQTAVAAEIEFPDFAVTAVSVHLDANSSQRHRRDQMRDVLDGLDADRRWAALPAIVGGDWNTTTYNSSGAFPAIMGFWRRVFMGPDNVIRNHYLHPDRRFERELFRLLEARGFEYRHSNRMGEYTTSYDAYDPKTRQNLGEWVPEFCFAFMRWALRHHGGKCPLKIDWFATRGARTADPTVIHDLREGRAVRLSDHDAIGVEMLLPGAD